MIKQAQELFEIDFQNSWLVGDKSSDIQTAINANIPNHIQVCSGHKFDKNSSIAKYTLESIKELPSVLKI